MNPKNHQAGIGGNFLGERNVSGLTTTPVSANNVFSLEWNSVQNQYIFQTLATGYSGGSGNGVNGQVRAMENIGFDIYLGGDFTQAGGYSNNARFAAYKNSNGWANYFYYPSSVSGYPGSVTAVVLQGNGSIKVSGSSVIYFTDQYGTLTVQDNNAHWWPSALYWVD